MEADDERIYVSANRPVDSYLRTAREGTRPALDPSEATQ